MKRKKRSKVDVSKLTPAQKKARAKRLAYNKKRAALRRAEKAPPAELKDIEVMSSESLTLVLNSAAAAKSAIDEFFRVLKMYDVK